ncbi:hypothetical protein BGZ76_010289 [Entomortierella beljakovae]|nr:hypothetical protein BGZ76_010289 [Entomortierella beljakovae]
MVQTKKIVLVTGCTTGGIGYEVAKFFEKKGCKVYAAARRLDAITGIEGLDIEKIYIDVVDEKSIKDAVKHIIEKDGRIDILFNNAGIGSATPIIDMDLQSIRSLLDANVTSILLMCKEVAPHMIKNSSGLIVNVGSVTGYVTTPWAGLYSASKAAVHALSDGLRMELKPFGINVSVVAPGAIKSNIGDNNVKRFSLPENSPYQSVLSYVFSRASASQDPGTTPTDKFANYVVSKCLKSSPPRYIDYGTHSTIFRFLSYLPRFISEFFLARRFGLLLLRKYVQEGKALKINSK